MIESNAMALADSAMGSVDWDALHARQRTIFDAVHRGSSLALQSGLYGKSIEAPQMTRALPDYQSRDPNELAMLRMRGGVESPSRALPPALPGMTARETGQAIADHPETAVSFLGLPGQIVGAAMANSDQSNIRGRSPMGAPRQRQAMVQPVAQGGPSIDQLMEQKKSLNEQRQSLDRQRATAVADRDLELRGGPGVRGGRGKNYDAKEAEVARLTNEMSKLDSGIERVDGLITEANKRLSPEYQMQQEKVREAEAVREQMLADVRKPFHEEYPGWSKVQAFAPAAAGALTMGAQAAINAVGNRFKVGKWKEAIDTANNAKSIKARTRGADISEGYNINTFPSNASSIKPYGWAATLGGLEGGALTNAPEVYNAFLPPLNQERQAYEEYLKRLPADHPERARVMELIGSMPERNPYREAAMDYFSSPAVAVRTAVGALEGVGGALTGKTVGGLFEPSLPRAEADALAKAIRDAAANKAAKTTIIQQRANQLNAPPPPIVQQPWMRAPNEQPVFDPLLDFKR